MNRNGTINGHARREAAIDPLRLPPQNLEAEQGVLGGIVLNNAMILDVAPILRPEDFYRETHQTIYRRILLLYAEGLPVDPITLAEELQRHGEFERIGGHETLTEILSAVPVSANAAYYAGIVRAKSTLRAVIDAGNRMLRAAYAGDQTAEDVLTEAQRLIFDVASRATGGNIRSVPEILPAVMESIDRRQHGQLIGLGSGFPDLDQFTSGFRAGQFIILAARPSMGKTALAVNVAENVATSQGQPALIVSLEMDGESVVERTLAGHARVDSYRLRTGFGLSPYDLHQIARADQSLRSLPVYIDDTPGQSMLQIASTARRLKLRHGLGLLVIDYLQLIDGKGEGTSRQEQVSAISRQLKLLARELQVPVIALSQLNRDCEKREDKRPLLADLRESGSLEQDADVVILLYRPSFYDPNDRPGLAVLDVAKNRQGRTGTCNLTFLGHLTRFESLGAREEPIDAHVNID